MTRLQVQAEYESCIKGVEFLLVLMFLCVWRNNRTCLPQLLIVLTLVNLDKSLDIQRQSNAVTTNTRCAATRNVIPQLTQTYPPPSSIPVTAPSPCRSPSRTCGRNNNHQQPRCHGSLIGYVARKMREKKDARSVPVCVLSFPGISPC